MNILFINITKKEFDRLRIDSVLDYLIKSPKPYIGRWSSMVRVSDDKCVKMTLNDSNDLVVVESIKFNMGINPPPPSRITKEK